MSNLITVGISDLNIVKTPDTLVTFALGSCVGICLFDQLAQVAGLSHILLPQYKSISGENAPMKFADSAIPLLIQRMEAKGARRVHMQAKIAGGAQMFPSKGNSSIAAIGQQNVQSVKATLQSLRIPLLAEDTGANFGRTLYFSAADYKMVIRSYKRGEQSY